MFKMFSELDGIIKDMNDATDYMVKEIDMQNILGIDIDNETVQDYLMGLYNGVSVNESVLLKNNIVKHLTNSNVFEIVRVDNDPYGNQLIHFRYKKELFVFIINRKSDMFFVFENVVTYCDIKKDTFKTMANTVRFFSETLYKRKRHIVRQIERIKKYDY